MPRKIRSVTLDTRTARLKLPKQDGRPHYVAVSPGIALGYRAGPGTWSVRFADGRGGKVLKSLNAIADDREDADGEKVLDFWQATEKARRFARGQDATPGMPLTLDQALADYAADLKVRGADPRNASVPRHHLTPALLAMPVVMLAVRDLRSWRDRLAGKMPASTVNRITKSVKACLALALRNDDRITTSKAWRVGLAALPEADPDSNVVLTDDQIRALIAACDSISDEFGLYIRVHVETGARSSQIALLNVEDLQEGNLVDNGMKVSSGATPRLMMPSSLKGKNRRTRSRTPLSISTGLAARLRANLGNDTTKVSAPLLLNNGRRWDAAAHREPFMQAVRVAGLASNVTAYALRHTRITRLLVAGFPARWVAASLDTSLAMLEKTYSRNIASHADELMRRAVFDLDADAPAGNVVAMRR